MELRVWVDGVQRIVCGVRLTTTCQEIVFVLAKATHQAGRFTMIERWRNNERLLSPNEQPLVTLQRWGEHMNEVEFILKKASSEIQSSNSNQLSQQQQQQQQPQQQNRAPQLPNHNKNNTNHDNNNIQAQQQHQQMVGNSNGNNMRSSPMSPMQSLARNNQQQFMEPSPTYQYNLNRRPQTSLGPLTSSSSALGIGSINYSQQVHKSSLSALHPIVMRNSLSTSTLPDLPKPIVAPTSNNNISSANARYIEEQLLNSSPSSLYGPLHNGYPTRSESSMQHYFNNLQQADQQVQQQTSKNHPFEELYSTINKKRVHNPPAVPAKPRVVVPMTSMANHPSYPSALQPTVNNAQANFFNASRNSPSNSIFLNNLRPRHPPGYSDYLEAIASRNSSGQHSVIPSSAYIPHTQQPISQSNNHHLTLNSQQSYADNQFQNHHATESSPGNYCSSNQEDTIDHVSQVRSRLGEPSLVINLGSAVNVKLPPNNISDNQTLLSQEHDLQRSSLNPRSVSEIGHDMLKMIEEQKKVLINQKVELDRLDNDRDYWETKQNTEQVELVNRIENEIHQLEELWRENQAQISKLEYQDLEKEVQDLKSEQFRLESEIKLQVNKLIRCEDRITSCRAQIDKIESELATIIDTSSSSSSSSSLDSSLASNAAEETASTSAIEKSNHIDDPIDSTKTTNTNGTTTSSGDNNNCVRDSKTSDGEDDLDDDSEGDYSDDLNVATSELKLRASKDMAFVEKRGLISGIRSLKLDKSRAAAASKQPGEHIRFSNNSSTDMIPDSPNSNGNNKTTTSNSNNNNVNNGCLETNGQYSAKTATSSNQYEFLMTL